MASFVDTFCDDLGAELQLLAGPGIFRDVSELRTGSLLEEKLAKGLCESACMVMIYTSGYFDREHPTCTREYAGMRALETERLPAGASDGLIIPIIVRGFKRLPEALLARRIAANFEDFYLLGRVSRNRKYGEEIKRIAAYIAERRRELAALAFRCTEFRLPSSQDVTEILRTHCVEPVGFPAAEADHA